jgi:Domain of unknown function (DUF4331)
MSRQVFSLFLAALLFLSLPAGAADHNDPNAINSIFGDVPLSAADLYDMFGWPADDGKNVILALTFAPVPKTGVFDRDLLYRIHIKPDPRVGTRPGDGTLEGLLHYAESIKDKYVQKKPYEVRVTFNAKNQAIVDFIGFPGGTFSRIVEANEIYTVSSPRGHRIKLYVGGRDDAFFNDLPGFFRSINYAPEFYNVPLSDEAHRELKIPKTLLQLEGNDLFNNTPPKTSPKAKLPPGPYTWSGTRFLKDANGNYRFVYSGKDAQAGRNINAIVLEMPLAYLTSNPAKDRIVNAWGEAWVLKASKKAPAIPNDSGSKLFSGSDKYAKQLKNYKRVDTDGLPFADAGLSEREDDRQLGANNIILSRTFVRRFGHLGWGFGPSVTALGLPTCFDHDNATVSKVVFYDSAIKAFPRVKKCFFQELNMPDNSWNPKNLPIKLKKPFEIFIPNVNAIDMDTNGTWPFGRRLEDQVATRFLSAFLDHTQNCGAKKCNVDSLGDQAVWNAAPIEPKTPPNPLQNDRPFLKTFPYLAEPWP